MQLTGVRIVQNAIVVLFIVFVLSGILYAVLRVRLPFVPAPLVQLSYQAMAPYQNYGTRNVALVAEGLSEEGVWEAIDPDPYLPYAPGEKLVRIQMSMFAARGEEAHRDAYRTLAERIKMLALSEGRPYTSVRIFDERWPMSPDGYAVLRHPPFIERTFVVATP